MSNTEDAITKFDRNFPRDDTDKAIKWLNDETKRDFSECNEYKSTRRGDWAEFSRLLSYVTKVHEDRLEDELLVSIEALFGDQWRDQSHRHAKLQHFRLIGSHALPNIKASMERKCAWAGRCDDWLLAALTAFSRRRVAMWKMALKKDRQSAAKNTSTKPPVSAEPTSNPASDNQTWDSLKTAEQKVRRDPYKFLLEAFPSGSGRPVKHDIVIVKVRKQDPARLGDIAEEMGLEAMYVEAPRINNKKPALNQWIIFGRSRDAVRDQVKEIELETRPTPRALSSAASNPIKEISSKKPASGLSGRATSGSVASANREQDSISSGLSKGTSIDGEVVWGSRAARKSAPSTDGRTQEMGEARQAKKRKMDQSSEVIGIDSDDDNFGYQSELSWDE